MQVVLFFWMHLLLVKIVEATNSHATVIDNDNFTIEGQDWEELTVPMLKSFLAICIDMCMKRQPNMKSYWHKEGSMFHYPIILNIMFEHHQGKHEGGGR